MRTSACLPGRAAWWLALALLSLSGVTEAQTAPASRSVVVKVIPQYVVVSGFWLEVEYRGARQLRHSFTFTPQLYAGPVGRPDVVTTYYQSQQQQLATETVRGLGLQVQHRRYLGTAQSPYPAGPYVSYGLSYQHFAVSRNELGWKEVKDPTGLPYYEYSNTRHTETINRYGATAQLGYQLPFATSRFSADIYAGAGWRTGQSRSGNQVVDSRYRSGPSDYGHQGFYFPAGFKVGVALR
jgi:hypothetical protein